MEFIFYNMLINYLFILAKFAQHNFLGRSIFSGVLLDSGWIIYKILFQTSVEVLDYMYIYN